MTVHFRDALYPHWSHPPDPSPARQGPTFLELLECLGKEVGSTKRKNCQVADSSSVDPIHVRTERTPEKLLSVPISHARLIL